MYSTVSFNMDDFLTALRSYSAKAEETDAELDARYVKFFDRPDIDGWEIRQAMTDLQHMDMVPDPTIVAAAFRACRRVNDFSLTVRILESVRVKCGNRVNEIWPYMMQVRLVSEWVKVSLTFSFGLSGASSHHGRAGHPHHRADGL